MSEARIVLNAVDNTRAAFESAKGSLQGLHTSATTVISTLGGLAIVGAGLKLAGTIKDIIESTAALHDLSIQTGATVEALTGLAAIGKYSDQSVESIGNAMNKLTKNMAGATDESKGTGKALEALGINFDTFKKLKPEEQMQVAAKAMENFADGSGKSAVAMALYGKEGAKMLPFLKDLAATGEIHAKVTTEQAAAADDFSDNLLRLKTSGDAWKKELALGMLPALNLGLQAFVDVTNGSNGLRDGVRKLSADGSLKEWTRNAITGATYVMDAFSGIKRVVLTVGKSIGAVATMIADSFGALGEAIGKALRGDFSGALAASQSATARQKVMWSDLKASVDTMWTEDTTGQKIRARMAEIDALGGTAQAAKPRLDFTNVLAGNTKAATESDKAFQSLLKTISEHTAVSQAELDGGEKLTTGQKLYAKAMDDVASGVLKLDAAQKDLLATALKAMLVTERASLAYTEQTKALHAFAAENYKLVEAYEKTVAGIADQNKALKDEIEMMGLSTRGQLELTQARNAAIVATKKQELASIAAADAESGTMSRRQIALLEEIRLLEERNGLLGNKGAIEDGIAAMEKSKENFNEIWNSVDKTAHDVFTNIFEGGQDAFTKLRNVLKSTLLDLLYQMTVKKWIFNITASVTGTGASIASAATGGGGALGTGSSLLSNASTVASLGSAFTGAFSAGAAIGTEAFGAGVAMMTNATGISSFAAGAGQALGAMGPVGWVGLAALAAYAIFSGDKDPASVSTGDTRANYDKLGNKTSSDSSFGFQSEQTTSLTDALQKSYMGMAASLGIGTVASNFGVGGNSDGKVSHFGIGANAGGVNYTSADNIEYSEAAYQLEASRAIMSALKGSELPRYLTGVFDNITASSATQEQINNVLAYAGALKQFDETLQFMPFENLRDQSYAAMQGLIGASGGLEALQTNLGFYFENFYGEGERAAVATAALAAEFSKLGIAVPDNAAKLRDLIAAQDISTKAGQDMAAALLGLAPAFQNVAAAARASAQQMMGVMANYASAGEQRQYQLEQIRKGLAAGGVNVSTAELGSTTRDQAWSAYKDAVAANDTRRADAIFGQLDAFAKVTEAASAASAASSQQLSILSAGGASSGGGGASAADSIKSAWQSITDSIWGEVKRIRGLLEGTGAEGYAAAQARFTIATAQARAGDQDAAKALPQLRQALLELADSNVGTLLELKRIQGQTAASLMDTNAGIAGKYGTSIPAFASGGMHAGGLRLVGERGWEVEATGPARIWNQQQVAGAMGGGNDNRELIAEIKALRSQVAELQKDTAKTRQVLVKVTHDGEAMQSEPA